MRIIVKPVLARRAGVSPSDVSADLCDERLGFFVAHHGGGQGDLCVQVRNSCPSGFGGRDGCEQTVTMSRPLREDPYYFDIRHNDGNLTRHWFNLKR